MRTAAGRCDIPLLGDAMRSPGITTTMRFCSSSSSSYDQPPNTQTLRVSIIASSSIPSRLRIQALRSSGNDMLPRSYDGISFVCLCPGPEERPERSAREP